MLLQQIIGSTLVSMLDGYLGYNQVLVVEEDMLKTYFITPWETYAYVCMPFILKNVGENLSEGYGSCLQISNQ
jgi:hypothetical protein